MKRWLVTGAARGLGAVIVDAAIAVGDTVVATGRSIDALRARFGDRPGSLLLQLDVTDAAQAAEVAARADAHCGGIDVLVNNAGYGLLGAIEEVSEAEVAALYGTNVFGLLNVTRAVLPIMRRQRRGHIVNMSSLGGYAASASWGAYHSSKFAVEGISEALRQEVAPLGIKVTVVEPAYFQTNFMTDESLIAAERAIDDYTATAGQARTQAEAVAAAAAAGTGSGGGDPTRLAQVILQAVNAQEPPFRLAVGATALDRITAKNAAVNSEIAAWRWLSLQA